MARRRRPTSEVSLFAFQDVMASVIGILFFVVLLVALNIVEQPVQAQVTGSKEAVDELAARARALKDEIDRVRRRLAELDQARIDATDSARSRREVRALHATLVSLNEKIVQLQRSRAADEVRLDEVELRLHSASAEAEALDEALAALRDRARAGPRVSYILDEGPGTPEPWLVELCDQEIRVGTKDGSSAVFQFGGDSTQARRERLLTWARGQDRKGTYFVLLIKPSSVAWAYELAEELEGLGFRFGTDLLPEGWEAFEQ